MNSKFLLAALAAIVLGFLGGWLVWGIALVDFYESHSSDGALALQKEEPVIWAAAVGSIAMGLLVTYIINGFGARSAGKGFVIGVVFGFLIALAYNMFFYSWVDMMDMTIAWVDSFINAAFSGVVGAVVGWILGSGSKAQAAPSS